MRKLILALSISLVLSLVLGGVVVFAANAARREIPSTPSIKALKQCSWSDAQPERCVQLQKSLASERLVELQSLAAHGDQRLEGTLAELGLLCPPWKKQPMPVVCRRNVWPS